MVQVSFKDKIKDILANMYLNEYPAFYILHKQFEEIYNQKNLKLMLLFKNSEGSQIK